MSKRHVRISCLGVLTAGLVLLLTAGPVQSTGGPLDHPSSTEPRVVVAKCLSMPGLMASEGKGEHFTRVKKDDDLHSRDLLVCIPGMKVDIEPASKAVKFTLWGNLPQLSDSPVLDSAVVLHDTSAYALDFTLIRGRVMLTNTRTKGEAKVWLRGEAGVELTLPEPGDSVALEIYGRWPAGVPFTLKHRPGVEPIRLWEVHCLKGTLSIKTARTTWSMAAPPGAAYFHGDSVDGPARSGPEKRDALPKWADLNIKPPPLAVKIRNVIDTFSGKLKSDDPEVVGPFLMKLSMIDKDKERAKVTRQLVVHAMAAIDDVDKVVEQLENSKLEDVRQTAVLALRHWIGARGGRDEKLYHILKDDLSYSKAESDTIMQLLHSPFERNQPETYETLIAYLRHRKQAVRELAYWHLTRLAPIGKDIGYDAAAPVEARDKAAAQWRERIPSGELPKEQDKSKK